MTATAEEIDAHPFLGGLLTLRQFRRGHRAGTDACLLAAALDIRPGECMADVGAGVGGAGLAALKRAPDATGVLIERDAATCTLAAANLSGNGMETRARAVACDIFDRAAVQDMGLMGCADVVISNPPFYEAGTLRASTDPRRRDAHVLRGGSHVDWLRATLRFAKPKGRLAIIHRPDVLPALLAEWPADWGALRLLAVHAHAGESATRVIIGAQQGSRAPMTILPPLVLHDATGAFAAEAEDIHRGKGAFLLSKKAGAKPASPRYV